MALFYFFLVYPKCALNINYLVNYSYIIYSFKQQHQPFFTYLCYNFLLTLRDSVHFILFILILLLYASFYTLQIVIFLVVIWVDLYFFSKALMLISFWRLMMVDLLGDWFWAWRL